jgi:hypothetical protein
MEEKNKKQVEAIVQRLLENIKKEKVNNNVYHATFYEK